MTRYAYSPHTFEIINTDNPSDWMGVTDIAPPTFDASVAGCFFRDGAWVVESPPPLTAQQQRDAILAQIDAAERAQMMPRVTRESLLAIAVSQAPALGLTEPQLYAANIGYHKLKNFEASIVALRDQMAAIK